MKENIVICQQFIDYLYGQGFQIGEWSEDMANFSPVYGLDVEDVVNQMMTKQENK